MKNDIAFPIAGGVAGAGVYSTIGGIGLVGGFGGIGIGLMGVTTAGTVVGSAVYGAVEGISQGDSAAFTSIGLGAVGGATVASTIGGVGVSFGGSAFGLGIGSMTAAGGIFGLGIYGLAKMFANSGTREPIAETFNRMEEQILYMEEEAIYSNAYIQAMMELIFDEFLQEQQFARLEIEDELELLKAQIKSNTHESSKFDSRNTKRNITDIELQQKFSWQLAKTISVHTNSINSFAVNNNLLASASDDYTVALWNLETSKQIYSFFNSQEVQAVAINDRIVAGAGFDRVITSWKLSDKTLEHIISKNKYSSSHNKVIYALTFSNQGDLLISGSADQTIKVWNSVTGSLKFTLCGHTGSVKTLFISPCDRFLVSSSTDCTIRIWDLMHPLTKPHIIDEYPDKITAVSISPNGKHLVSATRNNYLKIWCIETRKNIYIYKTSISNINSIAISPDNKLLAIGNFNQTVQLWNLETKELVQSFDACSPIIFDRSSKYLITGDQKNNILVWQRTVRDSQSINKNLVNVKWWEILGVDRNSSSTEIKVAYYNLARKYHPDVNSTKEAKQMMSVVNRAYQESRIKYI